MPVMNFEHELRLAHIENDYLITLFTLFTQISPSLVNAMRSKCTAQQELLKQIVKDSPENRAQLSYIRNNTNVAITNFLNNIIKRLQPVINNQLEINNNQLTEIDTLSEEEYRKLDDNKLEALEQQNDFLGDVSLSRLFAQLTISFYKNKKEIEQPLQDKSCTEFLAQIFFKRYIKRQQELNSPLIDVLTQLNLPVQLSISPSPQEPPTSHPTTEEYIWTHNEIYIDLVKIERFHITQLFELFKLVIKSAEFSKKHSAFIDFTGLLDSYSEEEEHLLEMQKIQDLRVKMKALHQEIAAEITVFLMPLIEKKKMQINATLSNLVEAKSNFSKIDKAAGIRYPRYDFSITPFKLITDLLFSLKQLNSSLKSSLEYGLQFEKEYHALEEWLKLKITNGPNVNRQLDYYQQQLTNGVHSMKFLLENCHSDSPCIIDDQCTLANRLYMQSHPIQKNKTPNTPIEETIQKSRPKRKREDLESSESSNVDDESQSLHKIFCLWADHERREKGETHLLSEDNTDETPQLCYL